MSGLMTVLCPDDGLEGRGTARVDVDEFRLSTGEGVKIDLLTPLTTGEEATNPGAGITISGCRLPPAAEVDGRG
jgi:hypothetical protein